MAKVEVVSCDNCGRNSFTDSGLRFDQIQIKRVHEGGSREPKYVKKIKAPEMHLCEQCIDAFYFSVKLTLKPNTIDPGEIFKDVAADVQEAIRTLKEVTDRENAAKDTKSDPTKTVEETVRKNMKTKAQKRRPGRPRKNPSIETQPIQAQSKAEL